MWSSTIFVTLSNSYLQLQAYFLVADDMMDGSITRRGQPCWYRADGVGNIAINDAFMLEAAIYQLLRTHFRNEKYYVDLLEIYHDVSKVVWIVTASNTHFTTL
jgi:geranylgeranyl pyrophosphate synthase